MKSLILFGIILISSSVLAQNKVWGEKGGRWRYDKYAVEGPNIYEIEKSRDTVVLGKSCEIYRTMKYHFGWLPDKVVYSGSSIYEEHITHVSGDTVFFYHSNSFHILYNFNANIGDKWNLGLINPFRNNCGESIAIVAGKGDSTINGINLKYIDVYMNSDSASYSVAGRIFERLGPGPVPNDTLMRSGYLFPTESGYSKCYPPGSEIPSYGLKCYRDDTFPLYETQTNWGGLFLKDCEINFSIGIEENTDKSINVFPNPFADELIIEISRNKETIHVELYNVFGQIVLSEILESGRNKIETAGLTKGSYYINISDKNGLLEREKLIKTD